LRSDDSVYVKDTGPKAISHHWSKISRSS